MTAVQTTSLVEADGVSRTFVSGRGRNRRVVHAVRDVSLEVRSGETLGIVGESGSGKSTLGRLVLGLLKPSAGVVRFRGREIQGLSRREMFPVRREIQVIFQDPYASLNPLMSVAEILTEPLRLHRPFPRAEWEGRMRETLDLVGLPVSALPRRPGEFSGGQQQRIAIARALMLRPQMIVADEALSALDVSIQAQILNLFMEIQDELAISLLFISHDLGIVRHISHRVAVMYLGQVVETADAEQVYVNPRHPYTRALLSARPVPDPRTERGRRRIPLRGSPGSPGESPAGCPFHPRCPSAVGRCSTEAPTLAPAGDPDHLVSCHLAR
jgi:oligopeptide/dipeptide ABC transporter ATP-binding protein